MMMMRSAALFGALALSACVQTGATATGGSASAADQFNSFVRDAAVAELVAGTCPSISMRAPTETLVQSFVDQMLAAGYTPEQLVAAQQGSSADAIANDAAMELTNAGVRQDDPATFCAYGQAQVQAGTRIGSFLG